MSQPSPQQLVNTNFLPPIPSAWVMANAGSGKTYRLTWRVVGLLLRDVVPESIWCVTYTNAAAAEMEERLIATLKAMHEADDDSLLAMLKQPLPEYALRDILPKARALYHTMLERTHGGVRYTTMHGLCQSLLQAFPLEAGIAEGAALLDGAQSDKMRREAIRQVLAMALEEGAPLAQAREHLVGVSNFGHAVGLIEKSMAKAAMLGAGFVQEAEILLADRKALLGLELGEDAGGEKRAFMAQTPIALAEAITGLVESGNTNDQARGVTLQAWRDADEPAREAMYGEYIGAFLTQKLTPLARLGTKAAFTPDSAAADTMLREQARVHAHVQRLAALALAEDSAAMQAIVQAATDAYQSQKMANDSLDYDDLLRVAHRLLTSPNMMPWVMHKLDYRLEHLLVDEAQDTSPIQWQMIRAFCEEIIAQGEAAEQQKTLFVVGDEKQSIYSFNGAAPHWLGRMYGELSERLPHGMQQESLAVSYRSSAAVLDWVNALCADEAMAGAMASGAIEAHQLHHQDTYGRVECWPLAEAKQAEPLPSYSMPQQAVEAQTAPAALAETIAEQLEARLLQMSLRGKQAQPGDVIILVRSRSALVGHVSAALMKRGVPVAGVDRLRLSEHPAVQDFVALMAWCLQPADDMALAQVMMSPLLGMQQHELEALATERAEQSLWAALQTRHAVQARQLQQWQGEAKQGAYAMLNTLLHRDKKAQAYHARMGQDALEVLDELLLYLADKKDTQEDMLSLVLQDLQREAPEIKREQHAEGNANAVRIMTVHGAKGLQAPIVILADTTRMPTLQQEQVYHDETHGWAALQPMAAHAEKWDALKRAKKQALIDEYYRLLYVAATRAEDVLVVAGAGKAQSGSWYDVMRKQLLSLNPEEDTASGVLSYEVGMAQAAQPTQETASDVSSTLPSWLHEQANRLAPYIPLRPSYMHEEGEQHDRETTTNPDPNPQAYGNCFHALMEWASEAVGDEEINAFAQLYGQPAERLLKEFRGLWGNKEVAELLREPACCEQDVMARFTLNEKKYEFRGQMDRLIITDTDCVVLDYKTSQTPPETMPDHYQKQLVSYVLMLRKFLPNHRMQAALLWTANARLDWVGESDLSIDEEAFYDMAVT